MRLADMRPGAERRFPAIIPQEWRAPCAEPGPEWRRFSGSNQRCAPYSQPFRLFSRTSRPEGRFWTFLGPRSASFWARGSGKQPYFVPFAPALPLTVFRGPLPLSHHFGETVTSLVITDVVRSPTTAGFRAASGAHVFGFPHPIPNRTTPSDCSFPVIGNRHFWSHFLRILAMPVCMFATARSLGLALLAMALAVPTTVAAPISVSALSNNFGSVASGNLTVSGSNWFASGFTTGTSTSYLNLTGVNLSLAVSGTASSAVPVVSIFSGSSNPTTAVATLNGPTITNSAPAQTFTFSPSSVPLTLSANTNYWVVLSAAAGQFGWYFANGTPAEQNGSGFSFVNGQSSTNAGSSWSQELLPSLGATSIQVQAVPEPSTIMLAGIGVAGAIVVDHSRRRRFRRSGQHAS